MNIVLFDKDLRITDHQPLSEAAKLGEVLPLYVFVPSKWQGTELSVRHLQFVIESLEELSKQIQEHGGELFFAIGEIEAVLEELLQSFGSINVFTHKENAVKSTAFVKWIAENQQQLITYGPDFEGVSNKLLNSVLKSYLVEPVNDSFKRIEVPAHIPGILFTDLRKLQNFKVEGRKIRFGQQGGELKGIETLDSFLEGRYANYIENHQKPIPSSLSSSRLSAYITWGNISVRTIFQRTSERIQSCDSEKEKLQLEDFLSKLVSRAKICNGTKVIDNNSNEGQLKKEWNEEWYQHWINGKTGIPIIDAAMRSLDKTGWLNFTLRGVVLSFICKSLLQDCRKPSEGLAKLFLDYEPVIHDFHVLQQSCISGKGKIINPVKVGKQLDPEGGFIRRYVPELNRIPEEYIHEPWLYPGFYSLGYEPPIVDVVKANKQARLHNQRINGNRKESKVKKNLETEQLSFDL
jgi:deoxyribodipyrimidine photo-lyase